MKYFIIGSVLMAIIAYSQYIGYLRGVKVGERRAKAEYTSRCIKYFGNVGYPASGYCKLFVGDIKARDE